MTTPITSRPSTPVLPQEEALDERDLLLDPFRQAVRKKKGDCMDAASSILFGSAYGDLHKTTADIIAGKIKAQNAQVDSAGNICARKVEDLETLLARSGMQFTPIPEPAPRVENPVKSSRAQQMRENPHFARGELQMYQNMATAHALAVGIRAVGDATTTIFRSMLCSPDEASFGMSPWDLSQGAAACQAAIDSDLVPMLKDLADVSGFTEAAHKIHQLFDLSDSQLPDLAERLYDIPKGDTEQYLRDVSFVSESVAVAGASEVLGPMAFLSGTTTGRVINFTRKANPYPMSQPVQTISNLISYTFQKESLLKEPLSMSDALMNKGKVISRGLPDYSKMKKPSEIGLHYASENIWDSIIREAWGEKLPIPKIEIFKNDSNAVAKVSYDKQKSCTIKEDDIGHGTVLEEFASLNFQRSLGLKHTLTPEIIGVGQYEGQAVIAKTFLEGKTFKVLMKNVGSKSPGTRARDQFLSDLTQANLQAGKAVGELQRTALANGVTFSESQVVKYINDLKERVSGIKDYTISAGANGVLKLNRYKKIFSDFKKNPGPATFEFGDVSASNFLWDRSKHTFANVDAEALTSSFSVTGQPLSSASSEFFTFPTRMATEAHNNGLLLHEINQMTSAFRRGYQSEFNGTRSPAADRFFEVNSLVNAIEDLLLDNPESLTVPDSYVNTLIRELDSKL